MFIATMAPAQSIGHTANGNDFKPADSEFIFTPDSFDCTSLTILELYAGLKVFREESTEDGTSILDSYSCRSWPEGGKEDIFQLDILSDIELFVGLHILDDVDLDVFLLEGCDTETCIIGANSEFSISLTAGSKYYLVVDGYSAVADTASHSYSLVMDCRLPGIQEAVCDGDQPDRIICGPEPTPLNGHLYKKPNYIQSYECSPSLLRGGEQWYAISIPPMYGFTVNTTVLHSSVDQALWLFDGCGVDANCLGYSDEGSSGHGETISFTNEQDTEVTVYLASDSFRAVDDINADEITLEFSCESFVAVVPINMGSLRAIYR